MTEINDIARFLDHYDPDRLTQLRARFPEARARFELDGLTMGDGDDQPAIAAAYMMLESVSGVADRAEGEVMRRLSASRWLELAGALLAALSSAGVVTALAGLSSQKTAMPLAMLAFVASGMPIVANWLKGGAGSGETAAQSLARLRDLVWEARKLQVTLPQAADPRTAVAQANEFARSLSNLLKDLGYRPTVRPV